MSPDAHAVALILLPLFTAIACCLLRRKPTRGQWIGLFATFVFMFFIGQGLFYHMCYKGQPVTQFWIPGFCLLAILVCVGDRRWRYGLMIAVAASLVLLSYQYTSWVHMRQYTGNPAEAEMLSHNLVRSLDEVRGLIREHLSTDDTSYPEGWFAETGFVVESKHFDRENWKGRRREPYVRLWHTWLTNLYVSEEIRVELWYPGGVPREAHEKIEWRDRP